MTTQQIVTLILALLQEFFANNPTVEEIEAIVPALMAALAAAKQGQAFSLPAIPVKIDGVRGKFNAGWAPDGR